MKAAFLITLLFLSAIDLVWAKDKEKPLVLGLGEYPPYHGQSLPHYGVGTQIVTAILNHAGIEVKYVFLPWQRAFVETQKGRLDGTALWERNRETIGKFLISDTVFEYRTYLFHKKSLRFHWQTPEDLAGYQMGGLIGYFYGEQFQRAEDKGLLKMERVSHEAQNIQRLLLDRVQLVPISIESARAITLQLADNETWQSLTYHPTPVYVSTSHLLLSLHQDQNHQILQKFNQALKVLQTRGVIEELLAQAGEK